MVINESRRDVISQERNGICPPLTKMQDPASSSGKRKRSLKKQQGKLPRRLGVSGAEKMRENIRETKMVLDQDSAAPKYGYIPDHQQRSHLSSGAYDITQLLWRT
jgi:hypothetical protein